MGYSAKDAAQLLKVTPARIRAFVRAGFVSGATDDRGRLTLSFQDLVLLRTAVELTSARISTTRVRRALDRLRQQLPSGRPLTAVAIAAEGNRVVVRDGGQRWSPEDGQGLFDFKVADLAAGVAPLARKQSAEAHAAADQQDADDWYALGCDLEICAPSEARDAYRRAIELEPSHVGAHVNLGRLLHEAGELGAAEAHYRLALAADPGEATAAFNLGVVLEDAAQWAEAADAYQTALHIDATYADAHYNLAHVYERLGRDAAALRHLKTYRRLTQGR